MSRRAFLLIGLFAVITVCTACQPTSGAAVNTDDPLGTIIVPSGEPITLGFIASVTGDALSEEATEFRRGVDLAVAEAESIAGHDIFIQSTRVTCSQQGGQSGALTLLREEAVVGVIGPTCSSACLTAARVIEDESLTLMSPSCGASQFTDAVSHIGSFARVMYDDALEGQTAADFAFDELGARSAVIVSDSSLESEDRISAFEATFKGSGGDVVVSVEIDRDAPDMEEAADQIVDANADIVYMVLLSEDTVALTAELSDLDGAPPILGSQLIWNSQFAATVNAQAQTLYAVGPVLVGPTLDELSERYTETYGEAPQTASFAYGYDAASILLEAIAEVAANQSGDLVIGKQAIRDALFSTAAHTGATGVLTCTEWGDCSQVSLGVARLQTDGWDIVYLP